MISESHLNVLGWLSDDEINPKKNRKKFMNCLKLETTSGGLPVRSIVPFPPPSQQGKKEKSSIVDARANFILIKVSPGKTELETFFSATKIKPL